MRSTPLTIFVQLRVLLAAARQPSLLDVPGMLVSSSELFEVPVVDGESVKTDMVLSRAQLRPMNV